MLEARFSRPKCRAGAFPSPRSSGWAVKARPLSATAQEQPRSAAQATVVKPTTQCLHLHNDRDHLLHIPCSRTGKQTANSKGCVLNQSESFPSSLRLDEIRQKAHWSKAPENTCCKMHYQYQYYNYFLWTKKKLFWFETESKEPPKRSHQLFTQCIKYHCYYL